MNTKNLTHLERAFASLPPEERERIIRHGVALRMLDLRNRLSLAESKVRHFEAQYGTTLEQIDARGLPDNASYEMHEDYILWHHWAEVTKKVAQDIAALQEIAQQGLLGEATTDGGH